jgi:hypothetical protein
VRQLLNWRFVATVAALAGLALLTRAVLLGGDELAAVVDSDPIERRIDLIEPIFAAEGSEGFALRRDGTTTGFLDVILPGPRFARISPGTLGEITCETLDQINTCALFADMLGDAVVWFAIVPQAPRATAEVPAIVELRDGEAVLENGWRLPFARVIERQCVGEEILSFSDFLRRFGPDSVSIVDLTARQVTAVRCAADTS